MVLDMKSVFDLLKPLGMSTSALNENRKMASVISITSATLLLYTSYRIISTYSEKRRRKQQGIKDIPIPGSRYPLVGHLLSLGKLPGRRFSEWHKELGPIINVKMGCQEWISIDDPILAHKVFVTHGADTSYRPYVTYASKYHGLGEKGIVFSQPNDGWNKNRSAALSVLASKVVDNSYMNFVSSESNEVASRLIETTEATGYIDPMQHLKQMTLNIIFNISFGRRFSTVDDPEFTKLSDMIERDMWLLGPDNDIPSFFPITKIISNFAGAEQEAKNFFQNCRDPIIRELIRASFEEEGSNLVKSLSESGLEMSEDEMLVFMFDLLLAGTDTVAITLAWNFAIMCNHPEVQKQVAAEIDAFVRVHGRIPNFNERTEVPLCLSVMKECMRYRPTSPFGITHTTRKDIVIDGYLLPKECLILANLDSMHNNTEKYVNPESFVPNRFYDDSRTMQASANGSVENRDHYNFGWGRRGCPGVYLAEVEVFFTFIQVFSRCYIEPLVEGEYPDIAGARYAGSTLPPVPYMVRFARRIDSLIV